MRIPIAWRRQLARPWETIASLRTDRKLGYAWGHSTKNMIINRRGKGIPHVCRRFIRRGVSARRAKRFDLELGCIVECVADCCWCAEGRSTPWDTQRTSHNRKVNSDHLRRSTKNKVWAAHWTARLADMIEKTKRRLSTNLAKWRWLKCSSKNVKVPNPCQI